MKRPRLLFALLRSSVTALATGEKTRIILPQTQNIQVRLAKKSDISAIQRCNLECLPENYNSQFYQSHLNQWPELAVVCEDVSDVPPDQTGLSFSFPNVAESPPRIIAYVLGKIETRPVKNFDGAGYSKEQVETLGHVTSLAVQDGFRRLGLAQAMMRQLHHHLQHQGIKQCGLHVRTSNEAACRLYQRDGYEIAQIIPAYYQDGEDAYFMRKSLPESSANSAGQSLFFSNRIWKTGPAELRLPRHHIVGQGLSSNALSEKTASSPEYFRGAVITEAQY
ncbi:unnamed protein product [Cylindrotheca closterium]|uniref:N-acetyltransferase domain-containing protein n=1 Tax=Cylindrotheca closterium TaxID=2856 RepID=A0AAD2JH50_9STRA|nr:unnamed protein product [Cylindrotheca closterium]